MDEKELSECWLTCSECGNIVTVDNALKHPCFSHYDSKIHVFSVNDYNQISLIESEKNVQVDECPKSLKTTEAPAAASATSTTNGHVNNNEIIIDDELLIEAVRKTSPLWNQSKTKMPVQTKDLWQKVCLEIEVPVDRSKEVQARWANLRGRYMKARKTFLAHKKSGGAAKKKSLFISQFIYFDQMSFLADVVDVPETQSTLSSIKSPTPQHEQEMSDKSAAEIVTGPSQHHSTVETITGPPKPYISPQDEYNALCKINDQVPRDIPTAEEMTKSAKKRKSQDFNSRLLAILEDNSKVSTAMDGFCSQVAEILLMIKNPVKRIAIQAALLTFLSEKVQEIGEQGLEK